MSVPSSARISRTLQLGRYLVGLLLSPMPDKGLSGGAETSRSLLISNIFQQRRDAPVPLGFQLSWKLRLGSGHVTRPGQTEAGLLPDADIPLDEAALPPSRALCERLLRYIQTVR